MYDCRVFYWSPAFLAFSTLLVLILFAYCDVYKKLNIPLIFPQLYLFITPAYSEDKNKFLWENKLKEKGIRTEGRRQGTRFIEDPWQYDISCIEYYVGK